MSPEPKEQLEEKAPRLKLFHFDDSFLQTINEWQARNAAVTSSANDDESPGAPDYQDLTSPISPGYSGPSSAIHSPRTLLSIATQKRLLSAAQSDVSIQINLAMESALNKLIIGVTYIP